MGEQQQELQQVSQQLQAIQSQLQELQTEQQALRQTKQEIEGAIEALERLGDDSTVQVPLGANTYVRATIEEIDEVIVELGADYSAQRSRDGAIETLTDRRSKVEERVEEVAEQIGELESKGAELEQHAQQLAQTQQMGGGPEPDLG